jgi:hypothetical protein
MMTATETTTSLVDAARLWFDAGYCVVPSNEDGGKRPWGRWKEYQQNRLPWDELVTLLESAKYTGIGVITGAVSGNAEMIEIEGPNHIAVDRLRQVIESAKSYNDQETVDLISRLTRGCIENSAGGGLHFFIRVSDGEALPNKSLAKDPKGKVKSETRGEGGFVIVAPTTGRNGHPEGATYMFARGTNPSGTPEVTGEQRDILHYLFETALDETPPETVEQTKPRAANPTTTYEGVSTFDAYRATPWADILTPHGWKFSHHAEGRDHWVRPGKGIKEGIGASTIDDGPLYVFSTNAGLPTHKGLSKAEVYAHYNHGGNLSEAAKALQAQGYGSPQHPRLAEFIPNPDMSEDEQEAEKAAWLLNVTEKFPRINWSELWADEREEEWIVEPLLAERRLVALYSAPKVGKSLLMLEMAAAIANGTGMFGFPSSGPRRTLYIDFENDPRGDTKARLIDMGYKPDQLDNLVLLSYPTMAALDSEKGANELMAAISAYDCSIVVIDTVSRAIEGEENENDTWLKFNRHSGMAMKRAGISMIRLDHSGKDSSKGQRGGSAKSGDVDAVWRMTRDGDIITLKCEAERFPITLKEFSLKRCENPLRHDITVNSYAIRTDKLLTDMAQAEFPKNLDLSVRKLKLLVREKNITFTNSDFTASLYKRYSSLPQEFKPQKFATEAGA